MTAAAFQSHTATTFTGSDTTAHVSNYPATVNSGDRLVLIAAFDGTGGITTPTGYTIIGSVIASATAQVGLYTKIATGAEAGGTIDVPTPSAERGGVSIYRYNVASSTVGDVEWATSTPGSTANPDPPSLTPSWGSADYAWICGEVYSASGVTDTVNSTGYANRVTAGATTTVSDAIVITLRKTSTASSDDPSAWTLDSAATSIVFTIAIRPVTAVNASITGVAAAAPAAGQVGAVSTVRIVSITGITATATAAGQVGAVTAQVVKSITGVTATATAAGQIGVPNVGVNVTVTGVTATATAAGQVGVVSTVRIVLITGIAATATAAGVVGVVTAQRIVSITGVTATATATGNIGAVTAVIAPIIVYTYLRARYAPLVSQLARYAVSHLSSAVYAPTARLAGRYAPQYERPARDG